MQQSYTYSIYIYIYIYMRVSVLCTYVRVHNMHVSIYICTGLMSYTHVFHRFPMSKSVPQFVWRLFIHHIYVFPWLYRLYGYTTIPYFLTRLHVRVTYHKFHWIIIWFSPNSVAIWWVWTQFPSTSIRCQNMEWGYKPPC